MYVCCVYIYIYIYTHIPQDLDPTYTIVPLAQSIIISSIIMIILISIRSIII